ncbi:MAG: hypothetical protein Q9191_007366 [Dirinaria sp. TL-2023a]
MRTQLSLSLFALSCFSSVSLGKHIPPQNILWGNKGPAGATLIPVSKTKSTPAPVVEERDTVSTDFDAKWPTTGRTVSVNLEITNGTCNPDGHGPQQCQLVNGQFPGPTIIARIHWHGIRQLGSTGMDGVPGITECPLAPGETKNYNFQLTQYGTTWYHSHYSAQYGMGVLGGLLINGPASSNYDIDLGTYTVGDWYYKTAYQMDDIANLDLQKGAGPPPSDTILVNGTNKDAAGAGKYGKVTLTKGKKYLLRIINTSTDAQIRVQLDGHNMTLVTSDLVPIKPLTVNTLLLGIGQRYNVIIEANQAVNNYWFRAIAETNCVSASNLPGQSIFSYTGAPAGDPTTTAAAGPGNCNEPGPLVPWVPNNVPQGTFSNQAKVLNVSLHQEGATTNNQNLVVWGIGTGAIDVDWEKPILTYVEEGNTSYPISENLIELPTPGIWTYWIIQQVSAAPPIPHPMHLHGHDFYVLGQGTGTFSNSSISSLTFTNPTRRDVAFLPSKGWLVIAFPTDNPGAWLMHCHIGFHISEGLGVQFLESKSQFPPFPADYDKTCADYNAYYNNDPVYKKNDSGL